MDPRIHKELPYDDLVVSLAYRWAPEDIDLRQDLAQEGRMVVVDAMSAYMDLDQRDVSERTWVSLWVYRTMGQYVRKELLHRLGHEDISEMLDQDDVDELIDYDEQHRLEDVSDVIHLLETLPEDERLGIISHYFDDKSYAEIAEDMSLNKQAIYRLVTAARKQLREKIS